MSYACISPPSLVIFRLNKHQTWKSRFACVLLPLLILRNRTSKEVAKHGSERQSTSVNLSLFRLDDSTKRFINIYTATRILCVLNWKYQQIQAQNLCTSVQSWIQTHKNFSSKSKSICAVFVDFEWKHCQSWTEENLYKWTAHSIGKVFYSRWKSILPPNRVVKAIIVLLFFYLLSF